jgi:glycosyltransferase involved in cell wall biosynthesis
LKISNRHQSIDVIGIPAGSTGWATHSIGFARAMMEFVQVNFRTPRDLALERLLSQDWAMLLRGMTKAPGDFGVVIMGEPLDALRSSRWIVWETTELPKTQRIMCDSAAFLWTPSKWGRDNLLANGIEADRVAVVPEGVDTDFFCPRGTIGSSRRFRFLMVGKWETRKFCDGLVHAFAAEFNHNENIELFLQGHNPHVPGFSLAQRLEQTGVSNSANIILGKRRDRPALRELYRSADCFVLPTRAEGWGLPILESMACGVPAIVTRYSAPLDYLSEENGYLLNVSRLVDAHDDDFHIHTGQWAEPDIAHLRFLMRSAFENRGELREKGIVARAHALHFSWRNSARVALQTIQQHLSQGGKTAATD